MSESARIELAGLNQRQQRLAQELAALTTDLQRLEAQLAHPAAEKPKPITPAVARVVEERRLASAETRSDAIPSPTKPSSVPPPLPPIIPDRVAPPSPKLEIPTSSPEPEPESVPTGEPAARWIPPVVAPPPAAPETAAAHGSFELRLGTYWLVRIGAVLILTGLVFLGTLIHPRLGPGGKVVMLYLASAALLGAGAWWQRKSVGAALHNYAQVLFAGGLAAVYFTTYAAHHVPALHIIKSALMDGVLLMGWAAFMAWIADRKKSELLAIFATGLAYYTSVITPVGSFTLYSNLVLTAAAVCFLVRNRWAGLSWASLVATYAAYGYWRFYQPGEGWGCPGPDAALWFGASFLFSYWIVFTLAVFLSRHPGIAGERRAAFLTFNNGALFGLFVLTMLKVDTGRFWLFSLCYGAGLLVMAELSRRFLANEAMTKNTYLTQGLVLVTVGLISHYLDTPRTLALVLAAESLILFLLGTIQKNIFLQTGAYLAAALSVTWGIDGLERDEPAGLRLGLALGGIMLVNAYWSHWRMLWSDRRQLRPVPAYFTTLALLIWGFSTWTYSARDNFPVWLALAALALTLTTEFLRAPAFLRLADPRAEPGAHYHALRLPEIPLLSLTYIWIAQSAWGLGLSQAASLKLAFALAANGAVFLLVGQRRNREPLRWGGFAASGLAVLWGWASFRRDDPLSLWSGITLGMVMVAQAVWQHHRGTPDDQRELRPAQSYLVALALLIWLGATWFNPSRENFPLVLAIEAVALTASMYVLRVREIPLLAQGLMLPAFAAWIARFLDHGPAPAWWNPLVIIGCALGLSHWWQKQRVIAAVPARDRMLQTIYALALVAVTLVWLAPKYEAGPWIAMTSLLAVGVTAYGVVTRAWPLAICGQIFLLVSGGQLLMRIFAQRPEWYFPLAFLAALGGLSYATWQWFASKSESNPAVRAPLLQLAMIYRWVALVMSLWWVTEYINERERVWVFALLGLVVFGFAGWRRNREASWFGGVFTLAGLVTFWLTFPGERLVYFPNLLALLVLLGQQQLARRLPEHYELPRGAQSTVIAIGCLALWRLLSDWVCLLAPPGASGSYLTASWSVLAFALFGCGVVLREKMYRWMGLGILAAALGRVMIFDVWKLQTVYRVLSFLALGIVLVVLGFIYNKYQEKLRQWL